MDLVGARRSFYIGSAVLVVAALVFLGAFRLRPGIEFTAGTTMLVAFEEPVEQQELRTTFAELGHPEARIQSTGSREFLIRTGELDVPEGSFTETAPALDDGDVMGPEPLESLGTLTIGASGSTAAVALRQPPTTEVCVLGDPIGDPVASGTAATVIEIVESCETADIYRVVAGDSIGYVLSSDTSDFVPVAAPPPITQDAGERTVIEQRMFDEFGSFQVREFASVSAVVSEVAVRNAALAVVVASLFIMAYVAFAFSGLPRPFRYGVCAIVALVHDVLIVLGAFALFGAVFGTEINLMCVTGLLTVIGFSVHDTIVVFDRIRENIKQAPHASLHENVNSALLQTFARSLNTSMTVLLTIAAMLALGGVTIREFLLVILVGVIAGTYSSVGIAAQLLVSWEQGELNRLMFWRRRGAARETV